MSESSPFWDFSLAFYARPGVAEACLELQDRAGVDINCLFLIIFLSSHGRRIDAACVAHIHAATREWRERVVVPLRDVRRHLKGHAANADAVAASALRGDVKRAELEAERLQQLRLEALFAPKATGSIAAPRDALQVNLDLFERHAGALPTGPFLHVRTMALAELEHRP